MPFEQPPLALAGVVPPLAMAGGVDNSPRESVYAAVRAARPADLESQLFAPNAEDSPWGGDVLALPSQVLSSVGDMEVLSDSGVAPERPS